MLSQKYITASKTYLSHKRITYIPVCHDLIHYSLDLKFDGDLRGPLVPLKKFIFATKPNSLINSFIAQKPSLKRITAKLAKCIKSISTA